MSKRLPGRLPLLIVGAALLAAGAVAILHWADGDGERISQPAKERTETAVTSPSEAAEDEGESLLRQATRAFEQKDFVRAEQLGAQLAATSPRAAVAYRVAGESAVHLNKFDAAIQYFDQIDDDSSSDFLDANALAGQILLYRKYRMSAAEARFRLVLERAPDHPAANFAMYNLLSACGRRREMIPYLLKTIELGHFSLDHLYALSGETWSYNQPPLVDQCYAADRECIGALFGIAQGAINRGSVARAKELLEAAIRIDAGFIPAQARLGAILARDEAEEPFLRWHAQLPSSADQNPDIWVLRGDWAQRQEEPAVAIRCYWEAVRGDPNLRRALFQLSKLLSARASDQRAEPFLLRSQHLQSLKQLEAQVTDEGPSAAVIQQIVDQMELLGRPWEAWGWCRIVLDRETSLGWARRRITKFESQLADHPPQTLASANPARQIDLSEFPLPAWNSPSSRPARDVAATATSSAVSFKKVGAESGFNFTYFSSPSRTAEGRKMYELTGGGVAALDFDADGWPDVYLTQGCPWPPATQEQYVDRLFHNRADGTVGDVTQQARIIETGFSQGAAVGDFNNDGFDDILVGNIGQNRLYRNNGDGTFADVSNEAGFEPQNWTTSCLIADLNGDGLPDLYCVNYLEGDDVFDRVCRHADAAPRMCKPTVFEAAQDRLYLNLGDGRFEDVTAGSGIEAADGKGLGIVAADFDGSQRLSLFVANDTRANFFFQNLTRESGARPTLVEQAYQTGLALNGDGVAEGCMGIAIGDCNNDQQLDLFVTNFYAESNTLYMQADSIFDDATQRSGLSAASLPMLGFGTQFLDADLDGNLDLIITNGHIDDLRGQGIPFQMEPQYFHNLGSGRFEPVPQNVLGSYFQDRCLGRGLAVLDWNRDGRDDVSVSHLDRPAVILENTTSHQNHYLSLKLRGTRSSRDAIGATATVHSAGIDFVRQLTAGGGYQASNERKLQFGLGAATRIDRLMVRFPSGIEQEYRDVGIDREVLAVEGVAELFELSSRAAF